MRIRFRTKNFPPKPNSVSDFHWAIHARDFERALLFWYSHQIPAPSIENPEPFKVYRIDTKFPTRGPEFLALIVAACERQFNQTPTFEDRGWMPYEDKCRDYVRWLRDHGDIVDYSETNDD